tara:strand:- start:100 stop:1212 length:1113 start_codon:yes stop_codon:yes gene_type:complete
MNKYFDICATTPIEQEVLNFINSKHRDVFGNPSSIHEFGQKSKTIIEKARINIAAAINSFASEIIFTCNGSVSNNIALIGTLTKGDHLISSTYEHPAILKVCEYLKNKGIDITLIKPNKAGVINCKDVEKNIQNNTKLISIMYVNNEIGTINPIKEISQLAKKNKILMHTDAVQAMGKIKIDVKDIEVDLLSLSGHKFYGPKGVGALFVKENTVVKPILFGGGQESDLFPGTENIINIGAIGKAAEICMKTIDSYSDKIKSLENHFINLLNKSKVDYEINGENRAPGILNITLPKTNSQSFIINLDREGYAISAGSACASGSIKGSHTLKEIGLNNTKIKSSYRISFSKYHTYKDVESLFNIMLRHLEGI